MPTLEELEARIAALEAAVFAADQPKKGRASALPRNWAPPEQLVLELKEKYPNVDLAHIIDDFRDYWWGAGKPKADWIATFRGWVRREAIASAPKPARLAARPSSRTAAISEANRERVTGALDLLAALRREAD